MDYSKTLNLPKTEFSMRANLTSLEPRIQEKWQKADVYQKIVNARKTSPKWILHDGPPYANGNIHFGTALNKILKDIFVKYKTMRGFYVPFVPGWDCHGLPIELKVQQEAGNLSVRETRSRCREYAKKFINIQRKQFISLGVFGDWDHPYLTIDPNYEASIIELFEKLLEKGHIYRQYKPIHWCMSCETALAYAELEYKDKESPSIYVRFPTNKDFDLIVWTTTPWTLPANVATVAHPHYDYVLVEYKNGQGVICESRMKALEQILGIKKITRKFKGKELENLKYMHPLFNKECPVLMANYVSLEDGTGLVHTAPGHGVDDYKTGLEHNLPILSPVDKKGVFTTEAGEFAGQHVNKANPKIIEALRNKKALLHEDKVTHSYPHCWRCHEPVIFRSTEQWFISIDQNDGRKKALDEIKKAKWFPEWGETRISSMLEERPDWCISRQRVWGVPIPAFYCTNCNETLLQVEIVRKVKEFIAANGGSDAWFDADPKEIIPNGTSCKKCGNTTFRKENDIFDVWFESSASHHAVVMRHPELSFPSDLYLEATDQHRGWFQASLIASVFTNGYSPFKNVLTHGWVTDAYGEKYSKSKSMMSADEALKKLGADVLRLWAVSVNYTDDMPLTLELLNSTAEQYKKIRNTFRFMLSNVSDYDPTKHAQSDLSRLDKWVLMELNELVKKVTDDYEKYEVFKAFHRLYDFCAVTLSSNYYHMLKDRLYTFPKDSNGRRSAQTALYKILVTLTKLYTPLIVHTAEEIWENIPGSKEELVHLSQWPQLETKEDKELNEKFKKLFSLRDEVNKKIEELRMQKEIGSSLDAELEVGFEDGKLLDEFKNDLSEIFVVSKVTITSDATPNGMHIKVVKSDSAKCERCWMHSPSVSTSADHPTICKRCIETIKTLSS